MVCYHYFEDGMKRADVLRTHLAGMYYLIHGKNVLNKELTCDTIHIYHFQHFFTNNTALSHLIANQIILP